MWSKRVILGDIRYYPGEESQQEYQHIDGPTRQITALDDGWYPVAYTSSIYAKDKRTGEAVPLPSGSYRLIDGPGEPQYLMPLDARDDAYVDIAAETDLVKRDIEDFVSNEAVYRDAGIAHRLGILLYGPPGNGKTSLIRQVTKKASGDSVVLYCDTVPHEYMLQIFKEDSRLKIFVIEELATLANSYSVDKLLDFLDGSSSVDHSMTIATTNYPELLPGNIVERPSRFDKLYKIDSPGDGAREALLRHYLKEDFDASTVAATSGLSAASIKEAFIRHRIRKVPLAQAAKEIRDHAQIVKANFADKRKLGL